MLTHLTASGIKNSTYSGPIAQVQLLSGQNRAGKTAITEAIRLALTNDAEIGGTPAKQSLLVSSSASVHASGGGIECVWTYEGGKRKHLLTFDGMEVKSLQGGLPVTVPEFWALTGDERWGLLEGVVGKFTLPAPADTAPIKQKIKYLKEQPQPEAYTGRPLAEVQAELDEVLTEVARQSKIRQGVDEAKQHNAKVHTSRESTARSLHEATKRVNDAKAALDAFVPQYDQIMKDIFDWSVAPSNVLEGSTIGSSLQAVWLAIEPSVKALREAGSAWALNVLDPTHADLTDEKPVTKCEAMERVQNKMSQLEFSARERYSPNSASNAMQQQLQNIKLEVAESEESLGVIQSMYDTAHSSELKPEEAMDMLTYAQLIEQRNALQETIRSATAWNEWTSNQAKNAEQVKLLEAELVLLEQHHSAYQSARAAYLGRATDAVEKLANIIIGSMGWPTVSVKIEQSGKRNTLTLHAGGVDVAAMSGGEALVYGAAVLNALQEGGPAKCPLLILEAAELDAGNLLALATALRANRTKGNVLISSHVTVDFENTLRL